MCCSPALSQQVFTTYQTTFWQTPWPHTFPALPIARKILPCVMPAFAVHYIQNGFDPGWNRNRTDMAALTDGATAFGGVIFGPDGVLYGSTLKGYLNGNGGAFQLTFTGESWDSLRYTTSTLRDRSTADLPGS